MAGFRSTSLGAGLAALTLLMLPAGAMAEPWEIPAPALAVDADGPARAVFAGGCFWGVQGVFQHVEGVISAVSGYAGGTEETARYNLVVTGRTDHAEAVEVVYDPEVITYGELMQILFSVIHDPTQIDRQGPDVGRHYRSAIFPLDAAQDEAARAYIAQLDGTGIYGAPIVTRIEGLEAFYPAEAYHQDFMVLNPDYPYIVVHDAPKLENFRRLFPERDRGEPVLVGAAG